MYFEIRLKHLKELSEELANRFKPESDMITTVLQEEMYEQSFFPFKYNNNYKLIFTVSKMNSWSVKSQNLIKWVVGLGETQFGSANRNQALSTIIAFRCKTPTER